MLTKDQMYALIQAVQLRLKELQKTPASIRKNQNEIHDLIDSLRSIKVMMVVHKKMKEKNEKNS